jgi:hypothetical protein
MEPTYPDDAFSRPADDVLATFETLEAVAPYLDVRTRAAEYAENELRLVSEAGAPFARWRFRSRGRGSNALVVTEKLRRAPQALSFQVHNRSARPVALSVQAHEMT